MGVPAFVALLAKGLRNEHTYPILKKADIKWSAHIL
jgi:hypothetical protein